jgi:CRISPR type III-B/RAMP module RAMP protein Cmr6
MGEQPLPPALGELLGAGGGAVNRSLVYDRGFDRYGPGWQVPPGDKQGFLGSFRDDFRAPDGFAELLARRRRAVAGADDTPRPGVVTVELYTQSRLVTGLGLPSPTETGLLLDRLTGCPYLPGSSVKGLLRHAAKLVAQEELDTGSPEDAAYWQIHRTTVFGPDRSDADIAAKGQVRFFDAFPTTWPRLELDVLTPHYPDYYGDESGRLPPGDWQNPVPVAFLTVAPGTRFRFHFADAAQDRSIDTAPRPTAPDPLPRLHRLLETALDWLGIGGKTSAGYGLFGKQAPARRATVEDRERRDQEHGRRPGANHRHDPPPLKEPVTTTPGEALWKEVRLEIWEGKPTIFKTKKTFAQCAKDELDSDIWKRLKKRKQLRVDARVVQKLGAWRIARIETVHS